MYNGLQCVQERWWMGKPAFLLYCDFLSTFQTWATFQTKNGKATGVGIPRRRAQQPHS